MREVIEIFFFEQKWWVINRDNSVEELEPEKDLVYFLRDDYEFVFMDKKFLPKFKSVKTYMLRK